MACKSRHLIVHCAAPSSVLCYIVPVDAHQHQHAFADLADDLLVDGDARALDALQHETHRPSACCCEEQQELRARQRELRTFVERSVQLLPLLCSSDVSPRQRQAESCLLRDPAK